jgi:hypothetical protein
MKKMQTKVILAGLVGAWLMVAAVRALVLAGGIMDYGIAAAVAVMGLYAIDWAYNENKDGEA